MLVLTRRGGESIEIGDQVRVTVLGILDNKVRLGLEAPKDVPVDRSEVAERKRQEEA